MNPISRWLNRRKLNGELAAEMSAHLEEHIDELRESGYSESEARLLAHQKFGNTTLQMEDSRDAWGWATLAAFAQDLRYGLRALWKNPSYSLTVVALIALGIGMNTTMFSAVKAVLLSALPYQQPDRLVQLWQSSKTYHSIHVSGPDFRDWRAQNNSFDHMAAYGNDTTAMAGNFTAVNVGYAMVGSGFFEVLGTNSAIGRTFTADDQKPGSTPTAILGYALAQKNFSDAPNAIGKTVRMNGIVFTVIGVMPPRFDFPDRTQAWLPNDFFPDPSTRSAHNFRVIARLKPGVTLKQSQIDMNLVASRLGRQYVDDKDLGIRVVPLYEELVSGIRPALLTLQGAVALVLLIACVNISGLQLARASARQKELALRVALGAARGRLIRQLLTESVLLSCLGASVGVALAVAGTIAFRNSVPPDIIPRLSDIGVDFSVLCFTSAIAVLAGLLFGILPAIISSKADANESLKEGTGKGVSANRSRIGRILVAAQIALATILLCGAALLTKSYWMLATQPIGFHSSGVLVTDLTWPIVGNLYTVDGAFVRRTTAQLLDQVKTLPGVTSAAMVRGLPFQGAPDGNFEIQGRPLPADPHQTPDADYRAATADYFKTFGIPILKGRAFNDSDERTPDQVAIVNQAFEKEFFPGNNAVGQRIRFLGMEPKPQFMTIIGVIPDIKERGFKRAAESEVFVDFFQHADNMGDSTLVVRGPATVENRMRQSITALNPDTAVDFVSMDSLISGSASRDRLQTSLLCIFAACALLLSVIGIYGLLSYLVTRRRSEFGIRMALGASRATVQKMILLEGATLIVSGLAIGLLGALFATRVLQSLLFQVKTTDPLVFGLVAIGFAAAALLGCYLPARRASLLDPSTSLRTDN